jgi:hypothetical protein
MNMEEIRQRTADRRTQIAVALIENYGPSPRRYLPDLVDSFVNQIVSIAVDIERKLDR